MGTRRRVAVAIGGVVALTVVCTGAIFVAQTPQATTATTSIPDDGSLMHPKFAESTPAGAEQLLDASEYSAPWALVTAPEPADTTIDVGYVSGPGTDCGEHVGFVVTETDTTITLASATSSDETVNPPDADGTLEHPFAGCTAVGYVDRGTVQLTAPVGTRQLFHAGLSAEWDYPTSGNLLEPLR